LGWGGHTGSALCDREDWEAGTEDLVRDVQASL